MEQEERISRLEDAVLSVYNLFESEFGPIARSSTRQSWDKQLREFSQAIQIERHGPPG